MTLDNFILNVCELIFDNLQISKEGGYLNFTDFEQDEVKMRLIFEEFVRNFYKQELPSYKVKREDIKWDVSERNEDVSVLPKMQTDISLESDTRKLIIDTKYYKEALGTNFNTEKIRSANLYQLFSYLMNVESKGGLNRNCEGILLYPTVKDDYRYDFTIRGHQIGIRTIDLNQEWYRIHDDLLKIINDGDEQVLS